MYIKSTETEVKEVMPNVFRKILTYNDDLMVCEFTFKKGAVLKGHSHVNVQNTYVISGSLKFFVDNEELILKEGESILFESNVFHSGEALEDSKVLDVFTPMRKDFL